MRVSKAKGQFLPLGHNHLLQHYRMGQSGWKAAQGPGGAGWQPEPVCAQVATRQVASWFIPARVWPAPPGHWLTPVPFLPFCTRFCSCFMLLLLGDFLDQEDSPLSAPRNRSRLTGAKHNWYPSTFFKLIWWNMPVQFEMWWLKQHIHWSMSFNLKNCTYWTKMLHTRRKKLCWEQRDFRLLTSFKIIYISCFCYSPSKTSIKNVFCF